MAATLVIANTTGADVFIGDVGVIIPSGGSDTYVDPGLIRKLAVSSDLRTLVGARTLTLSDGVNPLTSDDLLAFWDSGGYSVTFRPKAILGFGASIGSLTQSMIRWGNGLDVPLAVDDISARIEMTGPGTLAALRVRRTAAPGAGNGNTYTVRVNGVDTAITCTTSGAVATSAQDATNTVEVAAGDVVEIKTTVASGVPLDSGTVAELGTRYK